MLGLYVHVPFCRKKCGYCDFVSYEDKSRIDDYLHALKKEAQQHKNLAGTFDTAYIGGGTPSLLSAEQLKMLFLALNPLLENSPVSEYTIEANPESVTEEKAEAIKSAGINRISMGLQSHKPQLLKNIGRITSTEKFLRAYSIFRNAGFENINADLMTGLPGQTVQDFQDSMEFLTELNPEHISIYPLEIHSETPLGKKGIEENPDTAADMYALASEFLPKKGYEKYEISNFSKPGRESRHNMHYWLQEEYLGLGPAAASYINGERRTTVKGLETWIQAVSDGKNTPCDYKEALNGREKYAEKIILGLRLTKGIEIPYHIFIKFNKEFNSEIAKEFLEFSGCHIRIKPGMEYMANRIFLEFL